ncbi:hypothetical protein [Crenobacter luteus]|uniref:Uncharacterized protein n=1 Tax=Crenobacter luteus TaxID=1452487 RepID=A0A165F681_9NEIS|nr:hypothetical protein [Crenobacter luteus]KZE31664.1 hypothetical protein AVW16_00300 [Crenobacter luteus]
MKPVTLFIVSLLAGAAGVGLYLYLKPVPELGPAITPAPPELASAPAVQPPPAPLPARFLAEERARRRLAPDDASLTVCAELADAQGTLLALCDEDDASRAEGGRVDLYQLAEPTGPGEPVAVAARLEGIESGGFGQPGAVRPIRLGAHAPGFVVEEGQTAQGYSVGTRSLFALVDGAWRPLARLRSHLDNSGSGECGRDRAACVELDFSLSVDAHAPPSGALPALLVAVDGTEGGRRVSRRYTLRYDARRGAYTVPAALERTF